MRFRIQDIIPFAIRKWLLNQHQRIVFSKTLRHILKDPVNTLADDRILDRIIYGWGNQGWSAKNTYLRTCIDYAWKTQDAILECGSGLTTIILGIVAKKRGIKMISLEHNAVWHKKVGGHLEKYQLYNELLKAPLKDFGEYEWYDIEHIELPAKFGLVICDGPPATTKGGRLGLMPLVRHSFTEGTVILLDDMVRNSEKETVLKRQKMHPIQYELVKSGDSHAIITMG
ncbi:MAG: class I SAM-dependent methyltransferase [Saprospiraceae bacterium]|nr:class I SAM-dependent methyltransferase [Saprospiraceae bacterium]